MTISEFVLWFQQELPHIHNLIRIFYRLSGYYTLLGVIWNLRSCGLSLHGLRGFNHVLSFSLGFHNRLIVGILVLGQLFILLPPGVHLQDFNTALIVEQTKMRTSETTMLKLITLTLTRGSTLLGNDFLDTHTTRLPSFLVGDIWLFQLKEKEVLLWRVLLDFETESPSYVPLHSEIGIKCVLLLNFAIEETSNLKYLFMLLGYFLIFMTQLELLHFNLHHPLQTFTHTAPIPLLNRRFQITFNLLIPLAHRYSTSEGFQMWEFCP